MKIVLTGSVGNIGRYLIGTLTKKGHDVTVITSTSERVATIKAMGAVPVVGRMQDENFLAETFRGAELVYLMETMEAVGDVFDPEVDFIGEIGKIGTNYRYAIEQSGVKKVIHLSSIGADMTSGNGILRFHHDVETILRQLPTKVAIKFIRPVGFFTNLFSQIQTIKNRGAIISNYGGDVKEPWVSPEDIAAVVAEEIEAPFDGRSVRYVASDEVSPNEIANTLGAAIGKPDLEWKRIPDEELLSEWLAIGFNEQVATGFVEMQASQGNGKLYADYYKNKPRLGKVKLADFARDFAEAFNAG